MKRAPRPSRPRDAKMRGQVLARPLRLFVAAEVPEVFKTRFASMRPELDRSVPGARWSRPEAIHLTFKFLGATDPSRLASIGEAVEGLARSMRPFHLDTGPHGLFGDRSRPRVLWTAIQGDLEAAERLAVGLESALEPLGFAHEERPFRPHLTLARFHADRRVEIPESVGRAVESLGGIPFPVDTLVLFESQAGRGGSVYIPRQTFSLAEPPS